MPFLLGEAGHVPLAFPDDFRRVVDQRDNAGGCGQDDARVDDHFQVGLELGGDLLRVAQYRPVG